MIITKKKFKETVKKVIVAELKTTQNPIFTEEESKEVDRNIVLGVTEFYSKLIAKLYGQDNEEWIYNIEEAFANANTILNERMANNDTIETLFENLVYTASALRLFTMFKENEQEETVPKKFDVEEILEEVREGKKQ